MASAERPSTNPKTTSSQAERQQIQHPFYATVERGTTSTDSMYDEAIFVEVSAQQSTQGDEHPAPLRIRIDTVPQETMATSPDQAATMAAAMLDLINDGDYQLNFRVEYLT